MIVQSFEITAHISKSISYWIESFHRWFCSLVVSCLDCDRKVGGSIPCQEKATLWIRYKTVLFLPFKLQLTFPKFHFETEAKVDFPSACI